MPVDDPTYGVVAAFVARLALRGVKHVVVSPGSRSTPLTLCFAAHPDTKVWVQIDERSAGFFALGLSRVTGQATVLVCTSGTAAANYLPAVVEASHAGIPLIVCTADRPPECRGWGSHQTIDQVRLYGTAVRLASDLPVPNEMTMAIAINWADQAIEAAISSDPGPVHLNWPLRKPLEPQGGRVPINPAYVFEDDTVKPVAQAVVYNETLGTALKELAKLVATYERGVMITGTWPGGGLQREQLWRFETLRFAAWAGWPLMGESVSGIRATADFGLNSLKPHVITTARHLLEDNTFGDLMRPDVAVLVGRTFAMTPVRLWIERTKPEHVILIDPENRWRKAAFRVTGHVPASVEALRYLTEDAGIITEGDSEADFAVDPLELTDIVYRCESGDNALDGVSQKNRSSGFSTYAASRAGCWLETWRAADKATHRKLLHATSEGSFLSAQVARTLFESLPAETLLMLSNSMPIRDVDAYVSHTRSLFCISNQGVSGIDGIISTALGLAAANSMLKAALYVGDLALLHDLTSLTSAARLGLRLIVVCVDNGGGEIFSLLPIADCIDRATFEYLFRTPHGVTFIDLDGFGGIKACHASNEPDLRSALADANTSTTPGAHLIIVPVDADEDVAQRRFISEAMQPDSSIKQLIRQCNMRCKAE